MRIVDQLATAALVFGTLRSQWWDERRIRDYRERALVSIMRHALASVPHYQALGLEPGSIVAASDLRRFPVLTKSDLQRAPQSFLARGFARDRLFASRTSGSSGQPTTTYFDRHAWLLGRYALKMRRIAATSPLSIGCRVLIISEQKPEELGALADAAPSGLRPFVRQLHLSIHEPAAAHLAVLTRWRPQILYAFPSYLLELITLAERRGVALPPIRTVYTSSEVLTPAARQRIEQALAASVCDVYGSTEFKEVAWQCRFGRYHVNFESVHIEQQESGGAGPVVLTSLVNFAMPLLRFSIGDRATFGTSVCPCGRHSPNLLGFEGREGDMIDLPDGRRISPYLLTTAIESEESIRQYRIVQGAVDAFRIDVIVPFPGDSLRWRERLCGELRRILGGTIAVAVHEVDALPRAPSGKRSVFQRAALAGG
jgi:phenylacetate-CoA ligase